MLLQFGRLPDDDNADDDDDGGNGDDVGEEKGGNGVDEDEDEDDGKPKWRQGYGLLVSLKTKDEIDGHNVIKVVDEYFTTQLKVEAGASRCSLLGTNWASTAGYPPLELDLTKIHWLEQWQSLEDYEAHKSAPHLAAAGDKLNALMATGDMEQDLSVFEGPMWHLEKSKQALEQQGNEKQEDEGGGDADDGKDDAKSSRERAKRRGRDEIPESYAILVTARCKSSKRAKQLVELCKYRGLLQLQEEPGATRFTVIPAVKGDGFRVRWIEQWRSAADHEAHKSALHMKKWKVRVSTEGRSGKGGGGGKRRRGRREGCFVCVLADLFLSTDHVPYCWPRSPLFLNFPPSLVYSLPLSWMPASRSRPRTRS